jgi:uncharacterized membrane protein
VTARSTRLAYIDWLRGVAVLIMIVWHTLDSWTVLADRQGRAWAFLILLGGWAAPLFLLLAGVAVALAGSAYTDRAIERGMNAAAARQAAGWRLQKRGWQIFALAHVFRLQSFLLNPTALWSSLLKPDILNIMGVGLVAAAFCWSRATTRARQIVWLIAPAAAIVFITPASRMWVWPEVFRSFAPRLEAYIRPINGMGVFSVFPWVAFVLIGALVGVVVAEAQRREEGDALQVRLAIGGAGLALAGTVGMYLPSITASQFWTTSVSFFLIRAGVMTLGLPLAWVWLRWVGTGASPMLLFGQASLFVYWVHVELAYGWFTQPLHQKLPLGWAVAALMAFILLMLGVTWLWIRRPRPAVPSYLTIPVSAGPFAGNHPFDKTGSISLIRSRSAYS